MIMEIRITIEMTKTAILDTTTVGVVVELAYKTKTVIERTLTTIIETTIKAAKMQTTTKRITTDLLVSKDMIMRIMQTTEKKIIKEIDFISIITNFRTFFIYQLYQYTIFNDRDHQAKAIAKAKMAVIF